MKEITIEQEPTATHQIFWETNIQASTNKAFQIQTRNSKNSFITVWVPKSRVLYRDIIVQQPGPMQGKQRRKYFIPKFFTR